MCSKQVFFPFCCCGLVVKVIAFILLHLRKTAEKTFLVQLFNDLSLREKNYKNTWLI